METENVIAVIIAVVILAAIALYLGRSLKIRVTKDEFSVETQSVKHRPAKATKVQVAEGLKIEKAQVGDIAAIKSIEGDGTTPSNVDVSVLKEGKIRDSVIGDIVGLKSEGQAGKEKK